MIAACDYLLASSLAFFVESQLVSLQKNYMAAGHCNYHK